MKDIHLGRVVVSIPNIDSINRRDPTVGQGAIDQRRSLKGKETAQNQGMVRKTGKGGVQRLTIQNLIIRRSTDVSRCMGNETVSEQNYECTVAFREVRRRHFFCRLEVFIHNGVGLNLPEMIDDPNTAMHYEDMHDIINQTRKEHESMIIRELVTTMDGSLQFLGLSICTFELQLNT